jgi:hypothetical protein
VANATVVTNIDVAYLLYLPNNVIWEFNSLTVGATPTYRGHTPWQISGRLEVPVDLITAARLRFIKPGDDSGLSDEQWAWIRLIGLTGEST